MAYQPKSYRKFLAGSVSAALVATAVGPVVASAASFSDVNPNDSHAANISALVDLGYIKGFADGTFKPYQSITRGQVAKIFARILKDRGVQVPADKKAFDDVPVDAKDQELVEAAAVVKAAGVMTGSQGKLNPNAVITREQMAKVLVEAFDLTKPADFTSKITDLDKADPSFRDYIQTLEANGVTVVTEFNPKGNVTRAAFASFVKRAMDAQEAAKTPQIESVSAITSKSLQVTFNKPVDTTKAKFEVKKDGLKLNASTITFNEDKTVATIELASKLTKGEYTVTVTGLTDEALTKSVAVEDERVAKIEILSDVAVVDNTTSPSQATVAYRVLNQYGEDITKTTSLITNDNQNIQLDNGVATINLAQGAKVGDKVTLTLINVDNAVSATKVLTLSAAATVSDVEITGVYNKDGKTLNEDTDLSKDEFYLLVNVKDQYGNEITDPNKAAAGLIKSQSNPTVVGTDGANNSVQFTSLTINGKTQLGIKLTGPVKAGENLVTLISTTTGKSAAYKVTVAESTRSDVVTLSQPSLAVAKEDVLVPVTVLDKAGNTITDVKVLNNDIKGVTVSLNGNSLPTPFVNKDGATYVKVPAARLQSEGYYTLVAQSSTYKVATLTLNVKKAAEPKVITGLDSKVRTALLAGQSQVITTGSLIVEDQYGRTMTKDQLDAWLAADQTHVINVSVLGQEGRFELTQVNADGTDLQPVDTAGTAKVLAQGKPAVKISVKNGATVGDQKIKFDLSGVATSAKEEIFHVTSASEFVSYQVDPIGKVFDEAGAGLADNNAYDKLVNVYGVLSNGKKVLLTAGIDYTVRAENPAVDADIADGVIDANNLSLDYAQNATEVVVPVTVTINATGQEFTQNVTFSKVKPTVASVKFVDENGATITTTTATAGVNFDKNTLPRIVVTDSYGVEFNAVNGVVTFTPADQNIPAYTATPVLTFTTVDGELTFTNNGTASAAVVGNSFAAGESFNVKVTYAGGANATLKVTGTN